MIAYYVDVKQDTSVLYIVIIRLKSSVCNAYFNLRNPNFLAIKNNREG